MPHLDAQYYPHIIDNILFELHEAAQYKTLAQFRLTCSALRHVVDQRLPQHTVLRLVIRQEHPHTIYTRLWRSNTEGWSRSNIEDVVDVYDPDATYPAIGGAIHSGIVKKYDVVRLFRFRTSINLHLNDASVDTVIMFPPVPYRTGSLGPIAEAQCKISGAKRVVLNRRYDSRGPCGDFRFGYDVGDVGLFRDSKDRLDAYHGEQELVIMMTATPPGVVPRASYPLSASTLVNSLLRMLFMNSALRVTIVGMEEWKCDWDTDEGSLAAFSAGAFADGHHLNECWNIIWAEQVGFLEHWGPTESFGSRVERVSTAEFEKRVGPRMFKLMKYE